MIFYPIQYGPEGEESFGDPIVETPLRVEETSAKEMSTVDVVARVYLPADSSVPRQAVAEFAGKRYTFRSYRHVETLGGRVDHLRIEI